MFQRAEFINGLSRLMSIPRSFFLFFPINFQRHRFRLVAQSAIQFACFYEFTANAALQFENTSCGLMKLCT